MPYILASYLTSCRDTTRHQTLFTILVMGVVVYISRFKSMVCISEHWIKCIHSTSSIAKVAVTYYTIQACQHAQYIELTQIQPHNKWAEFYTQFRRYVWCIMCTYSLSWYIITDYVCQVFYLKKKTNCLIVIIICIFAAAAQCYINVMWVILVTAWISSNLWLFNFWCV